MPFIIKLSQKQWEMYHENIRKMRDEIGKKLLLISLTDSKLSAG